METDNPIIENPNTNKETIHHRPSSIFSPSSSPIFFLHNGGFGPSQFSDVEMITVHSGSYTSLRDLLPPGSSSLMLSSPTMSTTANNSSWREVPIKNPLVKHAALAYLQPGGIPVVDGKKGLLGRVKEGCCRECGCFLWTFNVILRNVKEVFLPSTEAVMTVDDDKAD